MANQWFKFYGGEYLSDPKIASLTPQDRSCWITLLCLAGSASTPGLIEYLTIEALLQQSGIIWDPYNPDEWDKATSVLGKFERMKMISKDEEGTIKVLNWEKRQETNLTNAERQARFREKSKNNAPRYERNARIEENRIDISGETPQVVREPKDGEEDKSSPVIPRPYSIEGTREAWRDGERRLQILEWFLAEKRLWSKATTAEKLKAIMARHNGAAVRIAKADWSLGEVKAAKKKACFDERMEEEFTLETIEKYLTK